MTKIDEKTKKVITEALTKIETRLSPQGLHVLVGVGERAPIKSYKYDCLVLGESESAFPRETLVIF